MELGLLLVVAIVLIIVIASVIVVAVKSGSRPATPPVSSPGWYPDPADPRIVRWFDGYRWTDQTQQRLY
ncbi:DUF2510 domain-containing protein [Nocardia sp. NPDC050175]|uniref:DUF2510 domain-containing protein n=1 Tax=Nocardia sp. NPDC050175 TaxID=3364317 RepID=UPI00379F2943